MCFVFYNWGDYFCDLVSASSKCSSQAKFSLSFHKQKVSVKPNAMKMIKTKMMREKKARHKRQESLSLRPVILGLKGRDCQKLEVLKAYQ